MHGGSLLEILVVIVLLSVLSMIALPQMSNTPSRTDLGGASRVMAQSLRSARAQAIANHRLTKVLIDPLTNTLTIEGKKEVRISPRLEMTFSTSFPIKNYLFFKSDGSATGGIIRLCSLNHCVLIEIDGLTGRVTVRNIDA